MINSLFEMHNIKYVISVDDCFATTKRDDLEASLYSDMMNSIDPYSEYLSNSSQSSLFNEIVLFIERGENADALVRTLLSSLKTEELENCIKLNVDATDYYYERDNINDFLAGLKNEGYIDGFLTFGSTNEAEQFDLEANGLNQGATLWLLDRNFSRVGESAEAGIELAENIVGRTTSEGNSNYVYIVSELEESDTEDEIEDRFDTYLAGHCSIEARSFIYYISKSRLFSKNNNRIAKSLSQGFKRKVCYELFKLYSECMKSGLEAANNKLSCVKQKTLNYLFSQQVGGNGESYSDFAARFVQIFYDNEYHKSLADKYDLISIKTRFYERLMETIKDPIGDVGEVTDIIKEYRDIELYNKHINNQHLEITTGDVFKIEEKYYVLISQSCDTYIRAEGVRKLNVATLLEIGTYTDRKHIHNHAYPLNYFPNVDNAAVKLQSFLYVPFEVLDLCVVDTDGVASLVIKNEHEIEEDLLHFPLNFRKLYKKAYERIVDIDRAIDLVSKNYGDSVACSKEEFNSAVELLMKTDSRLSDYQKNGCKISYPIKRLFRMSELVVADIARDYGAAISRIGHPFDYLKPDS